MTRALLLAALLVSCGGDSEPCPAPTCALACDVASECLKEQRPPPPPSKFSAFLAHCQLACEASACVDVEYTTANACQLEAAYRRR